MEVLKYKLKKKSSCGKRGFTLVEVMVCVTILSLGMIIIYEAFLISLDTVNFLFNRLSAQNFIDEKIWQIQAMLDYPQAIFLSGQEQGEFYIRNKNFNWQLAIKPMDIEAELYMVEASVNWQDADKKRKLRQVSAVERYFSNIPLNP